MNRGTVLVIDDDLPILVLMRSILREYRFQAVTASSGQEALEASRTNRPDVILLDLNMPEMSGEQLLKELRQEAGRAAVPVIILSGNPLGPDELGKLGAQAAILKPFDLSDLIAKIESFMPRRRNSEGAAPQIPAP